MILYGVGWVVGFFVAVVKQKEVGEFGEGCFEN